MSHVTVARFPPISAYGIEETGGGGADGGIDLVLRGNGETVLVQCEQWKARQVGVDKVRELFGVLTAERADRGILVTSGSFTREALSFTADEEGGLGRVVHDARSAPGGGVVAAPRVRT